ncbi:MAG: hypothetical protein KC502_23305, partial [Myxococcales bacterium]|nr:hypothetical protein [Myxococcales bacterium]
MFQPMCSRRWASFAAVMVVICLGFVLSSCGDGTNTDVTGASVDVTSDMSVGDISTLVDVPVVTDVASKPDTGAKADAQADVQADVQVDVGGLDCPGGAHCPCKANDDCDSALCIDTPAGKQCAKFCIDSCPDGFKCSVVSGGGGDSLTICVPKYGVICNPCTASTQCAALGVKDPACVDQGAKGAFCGLGCDDTADCPTGYTCSDSVSVEGGKSKQCLREKDAKTGLPMDCTCGESAKTKKLQTDCYIEVKGEDGKVTATCPGLRKCSKSGLTKCIAPPAQAEVCDGKDNDCDGDTDETTCDDDNSCTMDLCDPSKTTEQKQGCSHVVADQPCNADDSACTANDKCIQGVCTPGGVKNCDDKNPCTADSCDPKKGCIQKIDDSAPCDDENPCTLGDVCKAGKCTNGKQKDCVSNESCVEANCSLVTGKCSYKNKLDGLPCDDDTACTVGDSCTGGNCQGKVKSCDDKNPCTDDSCDAKTGCAYKNNAAPCDDNDACTTSDLCKEAACLGKKLDPAFACKDGNPCTNDVCDKKLGCTNPPNAKDCDDGNACSKGDKCKAGKCSAGTNVCECETIADCKGKEDGNLCNGTLVCDKSAQPFTCKVNPKTVISCPGGSGGACLKNTCNPAKGTCSLIPQKEGQPCDADGSVCTQGDKCASGNCLQGKAVNCDDKNVCTSDSCNPKTGCAHVANTSKCEDGQGCTVGDACKGKLCIGGKPKVCDDKDPCTTDFCDKGTGVCGVKPIAGCGGFCAKDVDCDDKNSCTKTACAQGKCLVSWLSDKCDDGSKCTADDACGEGKCAGKKLTCDDGKPCTVDSCNPSVGCVHAAKSGPCDDGNACTADDACKAGKCEAGKEKTCSDDNDCTKDACDPNTGKCGSTAIVGCGGNCKENKDCDDNNPCTDEACYDNDGGKVGQCKVTLNSKPCDDKNPCTAVDVCIKGKCGAGFGVQVSTLAGGGVGGHQDAQGGFALFNAPGQLVVESIGSLLIADAANHRIRRVSAAGAVSTIAGNGKPGHKDGYGALVQLHTPSGVTVDLKGNIVVADTGNHRIRRITSTGTVLTLAGSGVKGSADGPWDKAQFSSPMGVAVVGADVFVADTGNHRIRRIDSNGVVTTVAGSVPGFVNGFGKQVRFNSPAALAAGPQGQLFVADRDNHRVRRMSVGGLVTALSGGAPGFADGDAVKARFNGPSALSVDAAGRVWVADTGNHRVRRVMPDGSVTTFVGGVKGFADGDGATAKFNGLAGIAASPSGTLYLSDANNHRIRAARDQANNCKIGSSCWADGFVNPLNTCESCQGGKSATNWTTALVGSGCTDGKMCTTGDICSKDGKCTSGKVSCDDGDKCTTDSCNATGICEHKAVAGCGGWCTFSTDCDDNNPCTDEVCIDHKCSFSFNDSPCSTGAGCTLGDKCVFGKCVTGEEVGVETIAGSGYAGHADGEAALAKFGSLTDVAVDALGTIFVADASNHRIRR